MNDRNLILPNSGQTNWGGAINNNFKYLRTEYAKLLLEMNKLRDRIEQLDIVHTKNDMFVYLEQELGATEASAYICYGAGKEFYEIWDAVYKDGTGAHNESAGINVDEFSSNNPNYSPYDAFFVLTRKEVSNEVWDVNGTVKYSGFEWNTGDLLILNKYSGDDSSTSGAATSIEQWKNVMGGYFKPDNISLALDGTMTTTFIKRPNAALSDETKIPVPYAVWVPTGYTANGEVTFTPYHNGNYHDNEKIMTAWSPITLDTGIEIAAATHKIEITKDTSIYNTGIGVVSIETGSGSEEFMDLYISFRDNNNQTIYLAYTIGKANNKYQVTIDTTYIPQGVTFYMYVSLFRTTNT